MSWNLFPTQRKDFMPNRGSVLQGRGAILWGGGLGDVLVMRPLLQTLAEQNLPKPVYMTTASHLPDLFEELALPVDVLRLPRKPLSAVRLMRAAGRFEWVYAGPRVFWRGRLLRRAVKSDRVLLRQPSTPDSFIGEDIAEDVYAFGFSNARPNAYGTLPLFPEVADRNFRLPRKPYLVIHPSSKIGWETKQWPLAEWQAFLKAVTEAGWHVQIVGTPSEEAHLSALLAGVPDSEDISIRSGLPLWALERLIAGAAGVICHNSGVMHLAVAHRRRTLALTGSSGIYWRPAYEWVMNIDSGACSLACNRYRCPVPGYHAKCIRELRISEVLAAFHEGIGSFLEKG